MSRNNIPCQAYCLSAQDCNQSMASFAVLNLLARPSRISLSLSRILASNSSLDMTSTVAHISFSGIPSLTAFMTNLKISSNLSLSRITRCSVNRKAPDRLVHTPLHQAFYYRFSPTDASTKRKEPEQHTVISKTPPRHLCMKLLGEKTQHTPSRIATILQCYEDPAQIMKKECWRARRYSPNSLGESMLSSVMDIAK